MTSPTRWKFNASEAPKGFVDHREKTDKKGKVTVSEVFIPEQVLIATKCGKRFISYKLKSGRWHGLATDELPFAWQELDDHPKDDMI